jgi:glycosyltransferase involved in cell wall biosynthesis
MLLKLLRSLARPAADAPALVPLADLPPDAAPAIVNALRDAARAVPLLGGIAARQPDDALAHALHGVFLARAGDPGAAERAYAAARRAEAGKPLEATVGYHFFARGVRHVNASHPGAAEFCLRLAAQLLPHAAAPLEMLGLAGYLSGDVEAARAHFDQALARASDAEQGALEVNRLIDTLPQIAPSAADLAASRARFGAELDRLLARPPAIPDPLAAIHRTPFFLCYQGLNDRADNARLAELFLRAAPGLGHVAPRVAGPRGGKLKVGFISAHLGRHSVGVWYRDLVRLVVEGGRFDAQVFAYGDEVDPRLRAAAEARDAYVPLGKTLDDARARIAARAPDVLVYTDVGMDPFLYFLAFGRLAPLQVVLAGHPSTSGIPALDVFISNVHQDREDAQAHYSERLVRLPEIAVYVERTEPPAEPLSRAALGWSEDMRYYVCPMMLQKLHPDFDRALGEILRRDPDGEVVLFADPARPLWQRQLEARFARDLPEVADRIVFRPFAPKPEFLSLLLAADCVLDPFHFSGGVTSYIVLSLGAPLVTLPGELFRSRMTAGIYAQAGVADGIARSPEHYVELALAFAADPGRRVAFRSRITAAHPALFATRSAVAALEDWIAEAGEAAR